jgi:predicted Zn-dependent peptidase
MPLGIGDKTIAAKRICDTYKRSTLANGLRILSERQENLDSVAIGLWIRGGAQRERPSQAGITHFVEHMLFCGTAKHDAQQLAHFIEGAGGQIGAETDKEYTCISAKMLAPDLELALSTMAEMLRESVFDPAEIEKEKQVIADEIKMYEDAPDEYIHDLFAAALWKRHPLGRPVLGSLESVESLTRQKLVSYVSRNYTAANLVLTAVGNVDHKALVKLAQAYFGDMPAGTRAGDIPPARPHLSRVEDLRSVEQVHFCVGFPSFGLADDRRYALMILDTILGAGGGSRLFTEVRLKRGLAYHVASYMQTYHRAGYFAVWGSASPKPARALMRVLREVIEEIAAGGITAEELNRAKRQLRAAVAFNLEIPEARMIRLGRGECCYGRITPYRETLAALERIRLEDVRMVARDLFSTARPCIALLGPKKIASLGF